MEKFTSLKAIACDNHISIEEKPLYSEIIKLSKEVTQALINLEYSKYTKE